MLLSSGDVGMRERGIELGMDRGIEQAKCEMILGLKDELPIEKIAQISKLSVKEVEDILNSKK